MLPFINKIFGINTSNGTAGPDEILHINQEVYKKSAELSERNKTLLLLRKIDEIILSAVTDEREIARSVTSILVEEAGFELAGIFRYEKNNKMLKRLAMHESRNLYEASVKNSTESLYAENISALDSENIISQAASEKKIKSANTLKNSLLYSATDHQISLLQEESGVKSVISHPLIVRDEMIGILVIALKDEEQNVSEYTFDLLGRLAQVIGIAVDTASLYTDLQTANEKLKALDKLKDEFVSLASHELRTPMTAVKSYLWLVLNGDAGILNDKQRLYVSRAYVSVERLIKLVNDMLNISRIESGRITIEEQKVDLNGLTQEVFNEVLPRANELGIGLRVVPSEFPVIVWADQDKIKEVLFNLIGNSLKFTDKGGEISVSFSQKNGFIETKVTDNGYGISPDNIARLFQKFNMLPEAYSKNKNASGSGLGLYISRSIIDLHGGKMWAASAGVGKGSQFYFTLRMYDEKYVGEARTKSGNNQAEKVGILHTQI
jgi:signal transduction histidine kinase